MSSGANFDRGCVFSKRIMTLSIVYTQHSTPKATFMRKGKTAPVYIITKLIPNKIMPNVKAKKASSLLMANSLRIFLSLLSFIMGTRAKGS